MVGASNGATAPPTSSLTPDWNRLRVFLGGTLLLLCFGLFGWQVWRGRDPAVVAVQQIGDPARGAEIRVHITGAVTHPGVYRLSQGDRLEDAVRAAGGLAPEADGDRLNLAQRVRDEQRIDIPFLPATASETSVENTASITAPAGLPADSASGSASPLSAAPVIAATAGASRPLTATPRPISPTQVAGSSSGNARAGASGGRVNVNTASQAQLERLPGIGEVSARRLIQYRTTNGPLRSLEDLRRAGLTEAIIRRAADSITFE